MIRRSEALEKLGVFFDSLYTDKRMEEEYYAYMSNRNMNRGKFNAYAFHMEDINKMTDEELFWFASYPKTDIELADYFSKAECDRYSKSKVAKEKSIYPAVFQNVLPISDDQFVTTINTQKIFELYNRNVLAYNVKTQRAPKVYYKDGKEAYKISINRYSVREIKDLIERGLFISNDLTFNAGGREENDYYYDEQNARFVLKNGLLDILDGFHRIMAIMQVMMEDPDFEKNFVLNIMLFEEEKAKRFVAQQDKRNKIASSFSKSMDDTRYESLVTKKLNEDTNSLLFGEIKAVGKRNVDFGKTAEAVKFFFAPKSTKEAMLAAKTISLGLTSIYDSDLPDEFCDNDLRAVIAYVKHCKEPYTKKAFNKMKSYIDLKHDNPGALRVLNRAAKAVAEN